MSNFVVGWFGMGGNSYLADIFRQDLILEGITLKTCHEHPFADVRYSVESIHAFIDSVDVIILPSRYKVEPAKSVNRLALAWSRKKPCIVAPLDSYLKYATHMENAIVANEQSEWMDAIRLLRDNPELRQRLGSNGHRVAMASLDPRNMVHKFVAKLKEVEAVKPWESTDFLQIIIPHYQERTDYLQWAISSSLQAEGPEREVFVVSSSAKNPLESLGGTSKDLRIHHNPTRLNFSQAINFGLRNSRKEATHYLLLNDDTVVGNKALTGFYLEHCKKPNALINPYSNCDKGWLHNDEMGIDTESGVKDLVPNLFIEDFGDSYETLRMFNPGNALKEETLSRAPFCAFYATFIPKKIIDVVGLLSSEYSNGGEDADYCYRAHRLGFETLWTRKSFVFHFGGKTRKFSETQDFESHHEEDRKNNTMLYRRWGKGKRRVGIWTGPAWEKWDCNSYLDKGIGGSETCAGRLAQVAAEQGNSVCLYGDPDMAKIQADVEVIPWQEFKPEQEYFDLFISSRSLAPISDRLRARNILVWVHDIWLSQNPTISEYHKNRVTKFICLSPWHRQFFNEHHKIPIDKIGIIPNGVNIEFFPKSWDEAVANKNMHRLHYSSSPDRGLDNILYMMPFIKDKIPNISLHVFYGFFNWIEAAKSRSNQEELRQIENMGKQIAALGDSVVFHGRVNQPDLAKEWLKSGIWFQPTSFTETFCITAKEAQLSATPIVCSNLAALETTVGEYGTRVKWHPYSKEARIEYIDHIIRLCSDRNLWNAASRQSFKGGEDQQISWPKRWHDYWSKYF